ncbi:hypothetical protein [Janthinobacterium fluminis]|uniref:Uncharacterized protein n=1 Tax=Janthinobacterium fluminis TaxID=2987524 RepID=A0ABT5JVU7_9BURK|nr:hypothetical protein [Janthinobacterium fluminis]MDC8756555.1 hypothetical protein [Janthinobacterium fluminis]
MIDLPDSAECRCVLADGRVLTVTATRRPRGNRADVKCTVAGAPAACERMQEVVRLARHTEARLDSRDQVVLSMDIAPQPQQRDWELAAVLADRMVRGEYLSAQGVVYACGWSDAWHLGQVDGPPQAPVAPLPQAAALILGGEGASPGAHCLRLTHLGGLSGHTDPAACVSGARAWFPLHSGGVNDSLCWVEVSVHPLAQAGDDEEGAIAVPGLDLAAQLAVRQALVGARHFDGRALGRWRTVVRFGETRFQGSSYELALVLADRLARGREFVPRGRVIASGCSSAWHAGRVDSVEGRAPKLDLILRLAVAGDRVLLPADWRDGGGDFSAGLKAKGASVAWIERIGVI